MTEFFAMGGYAFYVWSAYGVTALAIAIEVFTLRRRRRAAIEEAQLTPIELDAPAAPTGRPRATYNAAGESS